MKRVLSKTFGGLTPRYLFRQYVFGGLILALMLWAQLRDDPFRWSDVPMYGMFVVLTLLYPYSRFAYESLTDLFVGENEFEFSGILLLIYAVWKFVMMMICWGFSWAIAPFGLAYLYYLNRDDATVEQPE